MARSVMNRGLRGGGGTSLDCSLLQVLELGLIHSENENSLHISSTSGWSSVEASPIGLSTSTCLSAMVRENKGLAQKRMPLSRASAT